MSNFICFNLENFENTNLSTSASASKTSEIEAKTTNVLAKDKIIGKTIEIKSSSKAGNVDCNVDKNKMNLETKQICFPEDYMKPAVSAADLKNEIGDIKLDLDKEFSDLNKELSDLNNKPSSDLNNKSSSDLNNKPSSNYTIYIVIIILIIIGGGGYYYYNYLLEK
jgi:hypothetical protein